MNAMLLANGVADASNMEQFLTRLCVLFAQAAINVDFSSRATNVITTTTRGPRI